MIAGLAAGLQPQSVSWPNGRVDNGWAASLAGDVAQTALLKVRYYIAQEIVNSINSY